MNLVVKSTWTRHLVGAAVLAALAACGGGGGGTANNTGGSTEPTASVTGVAAKGLMKFAKVVVKNALTGAVLKETTTDATGNYTVTGLPVGTAVLVEVSSVAGTKIVDEATNAEFDAPSDLTLRAATVADAAGAASVQVTPFSEMAVAKAIAAGGLSKDNIEAANADVRAFVGFDVLSVKPEFEVDSGSNKPTKPKNAAALLLASVSQMAKDDASNLDSTCTGTTQPEKVKCVVEKMATKGTSDEDVVALLKKGRDTAKVDYEPEDPDEDTPTIVAQPVELVPVTQYATAVDAAKALIANLRTNLNLMSASGSNAPEGGSLQTRLKAVATSFEQAANPVGPSSREVYGVAVRAAEMIDEAAVPGATFTMTNGPTNAQINCSASASMESGALDTVQCRIVYGNPTPQTGGKYVHIVDVSPTALFNQPAPGTTQAAYQIQSRLVARAQGMKDVLVVPTANEELSVYTGLVVFTRETSGYPRAVDLSGYFATGLSQALAGHATYNQMQQFTIAPAVQHVMDDNEVSHKKIILQLDADIRSGGGARQPGRLLVNGSISSYFQEDDTESLQVAETLMSMRQGYLSIRGFTDDGSEVRGELNLGRSSPTANAQVYLPAGALFTGSVWAPGEVQLFNGSIQATVEDFSSFNRSFVYGGDNVATNAGAVLMGSVFVPGGKDVEINLEVLEKTANGKQYYTFDGYYSQGNEPKGDQTPESVGYIKVLVNGVSQKGSTPASVTFTNVNSGVSFRLDQGEDFGSVTRQNVSVAKFNRKKAKIEYVDGSYEQY